MKIFKLHFLSCLFCGFIVSLVWTPRSVNAVTLTEFGPGLISRMDGFEQHNNMAVGADGNLWVLAIDGVARVTPGGLVTRFSYDEVDQDFLGKGITKGADGNIWISGVRTLYGTGDGGAVLRVSPSGEMALFKYDVPGSDVNFYGITGGPDGNLWAVGYAKSVNQVGGSGLVLRVSPSGEIAAWDTGYKEEGFVLSDIAAGADGNLWITTSNGIWRFTTQGSRTLFPIAPSNNPDAYYKDINFFESIVAAPDGHLWATMSTGNSGESPAYWIKKIARISINGAVTEFTLPMAYPSDSWLTDLTITPDGDVWFGLRQDGLGRFSSVGGFALFRSGLPFPGQINSIALGPGGELWFTDNLNETIGYTNGVAPAAPGCAEALNSFSCEDLENQCAPGFSGQECTQSVNPRNLGGNEDACMARPQGGNPVDIGTGNKYQVETDYRSGGMPLSFERFYNSRGFGRNGMFGSNNWSSTFERSIKLYTKDGKTTAAAMRPDGKILYFDYLAGGFRAATDARDQLTALNDSSEYMLVLAHDGEIEIYDNSGRLTQIKARSGFVKNFVYDSFGRLSVMTDSFGRSLSWAYDGQNRVVAMTDPVNRVTEYSYDDFGNLASVKYADARTRQYVYEDSNLRTALTGIIDEDGKRFATWLYDEQGRAISSEHAGGVEKILFSYGSNNTQVTDARNTVRIYQFEAIHDVLKSKGQSQPGGSGCNAASSSVTYDANGNISSYVDFNGAKVEYEYDLTRNLEIRRVEAAGTQEARTITTEWHPEYRLPLRIAEPKRRTTFVYDSKGNLLSKTIRATSDPNGETGFSGFGGFFGRTWSYTYSDFGQLLTADGPRTDVNDITSYDYDAQGNLTSITDATGKITTLSNYDANGRAGKITDPNGLVTDLTYSPRGWLTSKSAGGELTSYEYDGVGQMTKVTQPDGSYLSYTYDDAHRLTAITDNLGNRIAYTLDAMGNRINEQVQDPNGALARQTSRTYDALNRLQQITGAQQ